MRKLLLATTALTAAGLVAGAAGNAAAQTAPASPGTTGITQQKATDTGSAPPAPAPTTYVSKSAERIKLQLSGYFQQWGVFTEQQLRTRPTTGTGVAFGNKSNQPTNFATEKHNSEICFIGQTTLDNGLTIGVNVQLEANTSSDQIDESYLFIQSPTAGQLILGDENNAGYLLHVTAPDGGISLDSGDLTNITAFETNGAPVFDTALGTTNLRLLDNDSGKFTYITPRFAGFQAGISYIPEFTSGGDNNTSLRRSGNGTINGSTATTRGIYNGFAPGVNYTDKFGDFGVQASLGYLYASTGSGYSGTPAFNGAAAAGGDTKNLIAYNGGLQLSLAGFSVGGAYLYVPQGNSPNIGKLNGNGWTVGGAYEFGPYKLGIDYQYGDQNAVAGGGKSRLRQGVVSGTYTMGPGIRLVGGVFTYDWDQENNVSSNSGIGGATGLKLAF